MKEHRKLIPITIELLGITAIGTGIGIEIALGAEIGWAVITSGVIWGKFLKKGKE